MALVKASHMTHYDKQKKGNSSTETTVHMANANLFLQYLFSEAACASVN